MNGSVNSNMRRASEVIVTVLVLTMIATGMASGATAGSTAATVTEVRLSADVTGDGRADIVELIAQPYEPGSAYARSRTVKLTDGATGSVSHLDLGQDGAGYEGRLFTASLDTNAVPELIVTVATGGSGGITVPFVLTALGDAGLRHVPVRSPLSSTPRVKWEPGDHYQIGYEHDFGSGVIGIADEQPFRGAYSSVGKLMSEFQVYVDDVSAIETPSPVSGTQGDIITYRQAWAVFHANTVALVRTTWRWNGMQLVPVNVEVLPVFSASAYGQYLKGLDRRNPGKAVADAIDNYMARFELQPQAIRELAFKEFREFHLLLADSIASTATAPAQPGALMGDGAKPTPTGHGAGFLQVYSGEGMFNIVPDPEFYRKTFAGMLSHEYTQFLELDANEHTAPYARDASMVIPLGEVGARVAAWEHYLRSYPHSAFADEARLHYIWLLSAFLAGTNNTPHADYATRTVSTSALQALDEHVRFYPGTASAVAAGQAAEIYRRNKTVTDAVRTRIMKLVDEAVKASFGS